MNALHVVSWVLRAVVAVIFLQTLFFKFSGADVSVAIFSMLGVEPWGRIAAGIAELIAAVLLLVPQTKSYGILLSLGIIGGAIVSHLTVLGIVFNDDGGSLFGMAVFVAVCSLALLSIHRRELPIVGERFAAQSAKSP